MAGDWIKMRGNLWDDPRIASIVDATETSEAAVIGALYWLWATADQHTENGFMPGLTFRQIDRKTGVPGFASALCAIGWLSECAEGVTIKNFGDHNGVSAKRRGMEAQRKASSRSVSASNADNLQKNGGQLQPKPGAREEKRREEYSVPVGTAGKPAMEPDEIIFGYGLSMLVNAGTPEKQARSFLGGLRKGHGDSALIDKLRDCAKAKPLQPLEWLAAALPPGGAKQKPNAQEALEASNRAVAARFLEKRQHEQQ